MKLCPICDHELVGMFCPVCRKICREPLIIPDGIYLNKAHTAPDISCEFHEHDRKSTLLNRRHPENETECSYHNPDGYDDSMEGLQTLMDRMKTGKSRGIFKGLFKK